ncbi:hypothetical protein [Mesorhizobium prunaredense]|uniref:hypothetical protein n=2 Tax=Phyllobacteriaceae TaxID=69277 RepID=UPI00117CA0FA|nr:hypothetical protein [Mesorhizobium prunaredense]
MNYHDLEKAREAARKIPGGSGGAQAARNTGLVIRIAIASARGNCVMTGLLDEAGPIEKPELCCLPQERLPIAPMFVGRWYWKTNIHGCISQFSAPEGTKCDPDDCRFRPRSAT